MTNDPGAFNAASISFAILSDLHLETPAARPSYSDFSIPRTASILALLGDIGLVNDVRLFTFLREQLTKFETVFYVLGNHEPYDSTYQAAKDILQAFEKEVSLQENKDNLQGNFVLLDQVRYDISASITVLGCTLFSAIEPHQESSVKLFVSDFERIENWGIESHNAAHKSDLDWLNQQVMSITQCEPERRIVVFTHYSPTAQVEANDPRHLKDDFGVRSAFVTDLSEEPCWKSLSVVLWGFGHTHFNCDFTDATTGKRVLANQKGYRKSEAEGFEIEKVVEITTGSDVGQRPFPVAETQPDRGRG
jgi:hypothetical protein